TGKVGSAKNRAHLLAHEECDKLGSQLQHAVAGFVDGPRCVRAEAAQERPLKASFRRENRPC
ncbi:hypothetical protein ACFWCP_29180, partial [Streptomyces diastaticus]